VNKIIAKFIRIETLSEREVKKENDFLILSGKLNSDLQICPCPENGGRDYILKNTETSRNWKLELEKADILQN
jgi:hypothetical protein